jgi:hypothetical protein
MQVVMQPVTKLIAEKAENHNKYAAPINTMITFIPLPRKIMSPQHPSSCAPLSRKYSPFIEERLHRRSPAGSEPAPRWIKNSPRNRTRMTRNGRIFMDFPIRVNPRHPCNPCSTSASLHLKAKPVNQDIKNTSTNYDTASTW